MFIVCDGGADLFAEGRPGFAFGGRIDGRVNLAVIKADNEEKCK